MYKVLIISVNRLIRFNIF